MVLQKKNIFTNACNLHSGEMMIDSRRLLAFASRGPFELNHCRKYCGPSFVILEWSSCDGRMSDENIWCNEMHNQITGFTYLRLASSSANSISFSLLKSYLSTSVMYRERKLSLVAFASFTSLSSKILSADGRSLKLG
jgi:hypothetical protein